MTLAEKVRERRIALGLTQKQLSGDIITRSMLCEIEAGKAKPSLSTLRYLAAGLSVSVGYLADERRTLEDEKIDRVVPQLRAAFRKGAYSECIRIAGESEITDFPDEVTYLLAVAHLSYAEECVDGGSVDAAIREIGIFRALAEKTSLDTGHLEARAILCRAQAETPLVPKYSIDTEAYESALDGTGRRELYHYLSDDWEYPYTTPLFKSHIEAKKMMREHHYREATEILTGLIEDRFTAKTSVLSLYRIYSDLETCYRDREDFENAYRVATKKNALLTSFKN